jgi:hypothetical protein
MQRDLDLSTTRGIGAMLTAAVDVYANHSLLIIGTADRAEIDLSDGPANADAHHVVVRTRGQVRHTRVSIWSESMPLAGEIVFDGELDLADYTVWVGDLERLGRWAHRIGQNGLQRVVVLVDDPGNASRVHVGLRLGPDARVRPLPSVAGHPLPDVITGQAEELDRLTALGLVLAEHDSPQARLAAAITLIPDPAPDQPGSERFSVREIVEWLRWLGVDLSIDRATELGEEIRQLRRSHRGAGVGTSGALSDEAAIWIAATILERIR